MKCLFLNGQRSLEWKKINFLRKFQKSIEIIRFAQDFATKSWPFSWVSNLIRIFLKYIIESVKKSSKNRIGCFRERLKKFWKLGCRSKSRCLYFASGCRWACIRLGPLRLSRRAHLPHWTDKDQTPTPPPNHCYLTQLEFKIPNGSHKASRESITFIMII